MNHQVEVIGSTNDIISNNVDTPTITLTNHNHNSNKDDGSEPEKSAHQTHECHDNDNNDHHQVVCFPPSSDWTYFCEGGKHAVLQYSGSSTITNGMDHTTTTNLFWMGKLLRIDKGIFRGVHHHQHCDAMKRIVFKKIRSWPNCLWTMIYTVVRFTYVDIPYMILPLQPQQQSQGHSTILTVTDTNASYMASLRDNALATQRIPPCRRPDWLPIINTKQQCREASSSNHTAMLLLPDYRLLQPNITTSPIPQPSSHSGDHSICIAIELKPKCGMTSLSPLITDHRKYITSRYVLQQKLYQTGQFTKDWVIMMTLIVSLNNESSGTNNIDCKGSRKHAETATSNET
jgi:hypothetical protein